MMPAAQTNVFTWQGPSQTVDKFGRMKTERQMLLDATRVNGYSDVGRNNPSQADRTNVITGRRITARHQ